MDPYSTLASYLGRPLGGSSLAPAAGDVAKFIVLNAKSSAPVGPGTVNEPSWMSRIFDILSRPNYAVANTFKDIKDPNVSTAQSIISGLAGTQKTTFQDVLKQSGAKEGIGTSALGLGLDVLLDPTTYLGGAGLASKITSKLGKSGEALAKELPLGQKLINKGEPVLPESFGMPPRPAQQLPEALRAQPDIPKLPDPAILEPKSGFTTPQALFDLPNVTSITGSPRKITIPDEIRAKIDGAVSPPVDQAGIVAKEVKGQIPFKFKNFSVNKIREASKVAQTDNAHSIVAGLTKGNIEDALKMVPPPHPLIKPTHDLIAADIVKNFRDTATAAINKLDPATLNAQQQVKLWYKSREIAGNRVYRKGRTPDQIQADIHKETASIYKAVENKMVNIGKVPRIGTGENVKLSETVGDLTSRGVPVTDQVLKEFGTAIKPGSELSGAVERLRARGAITDSIPAKQILDAIGQAKAQTKAVGGLSNVETKNFDQFAKDFSKYAGKKTGMSPAAIKATDKLVNMTLDAGKSSATMVTQRMAKHLDEVVAKGKANLAVNKAITLALEKDLGKLPKWSVHDNKALEWVMSRVATWWGQNDLRPLSLNAIASSAATAEARGKVLNDMFKPFDATQRAEAFKLAQGLGKASTPEVDALSKQITTMMADLIGNASGSSVLLKSGVNMDYLNGWMRKYGTKFEFTKAKSVKNPVTGEIHNFSKGTDWLNSWKAHDLATEDPANFMFKTMQALEQATREKSVYDDLGERFGSSFYGKSYTTKIDGHPYLEGYYFPSDIAKQIPRMVKDWKSGTQGSNQALRLYDKVLSMWKTLATIYRPAHHIRNLVGDVYMGMLDGVVSVKPYRLALKVQRSMKGSYDTMASIDKMVEIGAISKTNLAPMPGKALFSNKSGVAFTAEQIAAVAHQKGLFEHVKTLEDIIDLGKAGNGISMSQPLGGHIQKLARGASELESHNTRLAHFIDVIMKSRGNDLPRIFEEASRRSRKYHPSGLDLTQFEKTVLRRIIPFYSWMRKSTPVLLEGMVMKPGITVLPAKANEAIQMANGIDTTRDNPFPVDQMFPQWIRNEGIGPVSLPDGVLGAFSNQKPSGYVQAGVGLNPISQMLAQLQEPGKTIGSSLSPALAIPLELGITGRKTFTGEPITGPDAKPGALPQYLGEQVPMWSALQGMIGTTPFGTTTKRAASSDNQSGKESLVNWLSGLGIKGTGTYQKSASFEKYAPAKADRAQTKYDFLAQMQQRLGG